MSRPPLAGCLFVGLMTLVPAWTQAGESNPSVRRQAEIDALISRRRAEKQARAQVAANRHAESVRRLAEARAHEVNLAQALATYQTSVERQALAQILWLDLAARNTTPWTPSAGAVGLGVAPYASGPVTVINNVPAPVCRPLPIALPNASCQPVHHFPVHPGGQVQTQHAAHSASYPQAALLAGHAR